MLPKGLFKTTDAAPTSNPSAQAALPGDGLDYEEEGFKSAAKMHGSTTGLLVCLNALYQRFITELDADQAALKKAEAKRDSEVAERRGKLEKHRETVRILVEEKIPALRGRIDDVHAEVRGIREDPSSIRDNAPSKASFWIGVLILACLTVYLLVFYSSASYSAFFRVFEGGEIGVANAIFDAQAFGKALRDGVAEFVLITMMPFVFLGLGFLIHKFQEQKGIGKYFKVAALIAVTFVFDAILAYEITHKLADLQAQMAFQTPEPYGLADAAENVQFWLIIFAGFVVYLIWGFVFDFTMEENEKLDGVRLAVRGKQDQIRHLNDQVRTHEERAETLRLAVANLQTEINTLETSPLALTYNPKQFRDRVGHFMIGWVSWLKNNRHTDGAVDEAVALRDEFLASALAPKNSGDGTALPSLTVNGA